MADKNKGKMKFIRKNGRIIPIRSGDKHKQLVKNPIAPKAQPKKKQRKSIFKGAALFGAGLGIAGLSNVLAGSIFKSGLRSADRAKSFTKGAGIALGEETTELSAKVGGILLKRGAKHAKKTTQKLAGSKMFKSGGTVLAGAIAGAGIAQIIEELTGDKNTVTEEVAANIAGFATSAVATKAFEKSVTRSRIMQLLGKVK